LVGFAWAFPQAGAQNAIASLWEVEDARSVEIMRRLYAGLAAALLLGSAGSFHAPHRAMTAD
jgi:CHAT domain-containing protein